MSISQNSYLGRGVLAQLADVIRRASPRSVFLVKSPGAYKASGAEPLVEKALAGLETISFDSFTPNPKWSDIMVALELLRKNSCDLILAVGGGSAIDIGKMVSFLALQPAAPETYLQAGVSPVEPVIPLVAIPTTAGSGSEATHFAVVYYEGKKHSVAHEDILPRYCLVDSSLTDSLPPLWSAASGLDAFCQAVESMWAVQSDDESTACSRKAIALSFDQLAVASTSPTQASRDAMCEASHLAGKAINISKTTACHALSYTMTSMLGVPHGHAVAMTLGAVMAYNYGVGEDDCNDPRGCEHVRARIDEILQLLGTTDIEEGRERIDSLIESTGLTTSLTAIGITGAEALEELADGVNAERLGNNPRKFTRDGILSMLQELQSRSHPGES